MAKKEYTLASEEAAHRYGGEIGDKVELDLDAGEALAVVAAGWLKPVEKK